MLKEIVLFHVLLGFGLPAIAILADKVSAGDSASELVVQLTDQLEDKKQEISAIIKNISRSAARLETEDKQLTDARLELRSIVKELKIMTGIFQAEAEKNGAYRSLRNKADALKAELRLLGQDDISRMNESKEKQQKWTELNREAVQKMQDLAPEVWAGIREYKLRESDLNELIAWRVPIVFSHQPEIAELLAKLELSKSLRDQLESELLKAKGEVTPAIYLAALQKPSFRQGHSLPPLTRYGWTLPMDVNISLARDWGYALEMGGYWSQRNADRLGMPFTKEAQLVELAKSEKLKVFAITNREIPDTLPPQTWTRNSKGKLLLDNAHSYDGTEWHPDIKTVVSPEAPDSVWLEYGRLRAEPIAQLRKQVPVSVVVNGGEYGIGVMGFAAKAWIQDPKIRAAKKGKSWFEYISSRKGHAETQIADQVRRAVPDRELYVYYTTGNPHRKRYPWYWIWGYDFKYMKPASDLASNAHYYEHFNTGFIGTADMLTMATNVKAYDIANGQPFDYSWFWGKQTDIGRWMGFLKCLYVAGSVGGNAGWYEHTDFGAPFQPGNPPAWIKDMVALARVHALFTFLEEDIRKGELVGGPSSHAWSRELPAYELVPEENGDQGLGISKSSDLQFAKPGRRLRVLARKHKDAPRWLIVAWAAFGDASEVTVNLPGYGPLKLLARPSGSVYLLDQRKGDKQAVLVDRDAFLPSISAARLFRPGK